MYKKILKHKIITQNYPKTSPDSSLFIGKPEIDLEKCTRCGECMVHCPSNAIVIDKNSNEIGINYDECIFCALCEDICSNGSAKMTTKFELAENDRNKLRMRKIVITENNMIDKSYETLSLELKKKINKLFKRSLQIREVDAGSCNACDYEINAVNNPFNDIERLGIHFVASPRHADMLLVTGSITRNMENALIKTYNATPDPKLVVAVGACACSGGIFKGNYATNNGIDSILPVDVYIPGCPPRPQTIIYGILKALDRKS